MANPSKAKGTRWETEVVRFLQEAGHPAHRRPQQGAKDVGDIGGVPGWTLEAKSVKEIRLAEFLDQANREAVHAGDPYGAAVIKRRGRPVQDGYVVMDLATFATFSALGANPGGPTGHDPLDDMFPADMVDIDKIPGLIREARTRSPKS